jgi:LysR family transcriptional regulator, regulator for genes of the gallate degradation pathway
LRRLNAFVSTVKQGSVMAAADAIHLSQPAVTQAIAALEQATDLTLFERRPNGMSPTAAAHVLLPRAEAALAYIRSPRITGTQARAFLALAKAGDYGGAALATGVTAPSLHRAVGDLENAIGKNLIARRGRGLVLTAAGHEAVRTLSLAHAELEAALSELAELRGRRSGRISVGAMPLCRARLLPDAIVLFRQRHPEIEFSISEGAHADLIEPLRNGDIDLMIGALRQPSPGRDVEQTPLFDDNPVVVGRAGHPASRERGATSLKSLARYPWIVPAPGAPLREHWRRLFEDEGVPTPPAPIQCGSVIALRQIMLQTDCLTLLSPDQVALEIQAGWLTILRETPTDLKRTIGFTTRNGWRPTPMQAAFIDILGEISASYAGPPPAQQSRTSRK